MRASLRILALCAVFVSAEDGLAGWLRYAPIPDDTILQQGLESLPSVIVSLNSSRVSPVYTAAKELQAGILGVVGENLNVSYETTASEQSSSLIVGTAAAFNDNYGTQVDVSKFAPDGFLLRVKKGSVTIVGQNERGALYGAFEYLSRIARGDFAEVELLSNPDAPIRWVNHWDNLDGSIERGYAGLSIFFGNGLVLPDLTRVAQYARLLASIKINAIVPNNVNANANTLNATNIEGLGRIADVLRPWGIQLGLSLNFASPQLLGGLNTFDPLEPAVISWWSEKTAELYKRVPDLAGFLVKANSEGQPGPLTYNRTLADGANLFAKAVQPYGGIVLFRAFVYNHHADWNVWTNDRANAAVEFFNHLDGKFLDNVVVQIKYGAIDFQVREPANPLFANIPETSKAIELQITQEYLGQQSHFVYIPPLWKEILDFDFRDESKTSLVRDIVAGRRYNNSLGGYAGVVNVGTNTSWLGHHLAMSNLYAYGLLAWDPTLSAEDILDDWTRLTFGFDPDVLKTVSDISLATWPAYEDYSGNLGIQTLTDILYTHFGPNPASQDNNGWGQWTRATQTHIGMDRTVRNGTGNAGQYPHEVAAAFENIETTPDNLILWFHHVPYTHRLKSGKTVIQHFYDAHYDGAQTAQTFPVRWEALRNKIDVQRFEEVLFRLTYQAGHAIVWRDSINNFYHNLSRIDDEHGRVGNHPHRIEAERFNLKGYSLVKADPVETASNFTAVAITAADGRGEAVIKLDDVVSGTYDVAFAYYDVIGGRARYSAFLNEQPLLEWIGNLEDKLGHAFSNKIDGHSATRVTVKKVEIQKGDEIKIVGVKDGVETAALDYVAIVPPGELD
ncbi:glycoside hydrolase superfamily [Podospora fimiseda]|uniref:Alpha-glucuronidase n=1 Tax=Podospora fimiseda TaxID=252190 RepID=A0AAN6YRG0_9PEZI|nr:glycoside hydrolase superfamily [Podospora fimiseda]